MYINICINIYAYIFNIYIYTGGSADVREAAVSQRLCVEMYIYIYIYMYIYTSRYRYTYKHICICIHIYIYIDIYVYMYICMYIYIYIYIYIFKNIHIQENRRMYRKLQCYKDCASTYTCTYVYIHIFT